MNPLKNRLIFNVSALVIIFAFYSCSKNNPAPSSVVDSFTPTMGVVGTTVTIAGANFSTTSADNKVEFNGTSAIVTSSTTTTITTTVPIGAATGTITVTVNGHSVISSSAFTVEPDIYLLGLNKSGDTYYWKNGIATSITNMDGVRNIAATGTDIYISGTAMNHASIDQAAVSKNGLIALLSMTSGSTYSYASDIFLSGSDVYVCGYEQIASSEFQGKYWKNGLETLLSNSTAKNTFISCIEVDGENVYVGGEVHGRATIWKNGTSMTLSTDSSWVNSVSLSNGDVYVAGYEYNASNLQVAKYWKNGIATPLSDGTTNAFISSIKVVNDDVYATGSIFDMSGLSIAIYWKNGTATTLYTGPYLSYGSRIEVSKDNDVYILGGINNGSYISAALWKNGTVVDPFTGTNFNINAWAMCLN